MKEKISLIDNKPDDIAMAVSAMRVALPKMIEYQVLIAEIQAAKFKALKKQGMDNADALELCKKIL